MFEISIGRSVSINSESLVSPLIVLGQIGQGRSTAIEKILVELVSRNQKGIYYDPFGDLCLDFEHNFISEEAKNRYQVISQEDSALILEMAQKKMVLIQGKKMEDGAINTRKKGKALMKRIIPILKKEDWLIVDEAWEYVEDDLFESYFSGNVKTVLSIESMIPLSSPQRSVAFKSCTNLIVYKSRRIDGKLLEENFPEYFSIKDLSAIKQYHFQYFDRENISYDTVPWPIEKI